MKVCGLLATIGFAVAGDIASYAQAADWGYEGGIGPEHWAALSSDYALCETGLHQSPVDIVATTDADLPEIDFDYRDSSARFVHKGGTVQVEFDDGGGIEVNGMRFDLIQGHVHLPSETHIHGTEYPMEMHLVHAGSDGHLAVIGIVYQAGAGNGALAGLWQSLPESAGDSISIPGLLNAESLLPDDRDYYRFSGSLTTPPCSEGVTWMVLRNPVEATTRTMERTAAVIGHRNDRPVQPLNSRLVLK